MKHLRLATLAAAIGLAAFATPTQATETYISLPIGSYHLDSRTRPNGKPYNEKQLGTGISFGQRIGADWQLGYQVGTYSNSYDRRSNYAAAEVGYRFTDDIRAGVLLGAISGYGGNKVWGNYGPLVAPQVEVAVTKQLSTTLTFVPTTIRNGSNAIALQLNYNF